MPPGSKSATDPPAPKCKHLRVTHYDGTCQAGWLWCCDCESLVPIEAVVVSLSAATQLMINEVLAMVKELNDGAKATAAATRADSTGKVEQRTSPEEGQPKPKPNIDYLK